MVDKCPLDMSLPASGTPFPTWIPSPTVIHLNLERVVPSSPGVSLVWPLPLLLPVLAHSTKPEAKWPQGSLCVLSCIAPITAFTIICCFLMCLLSVLFCQNY